MTPAPESKTEWLLAAGYGHTVKLNRAETDDQGLFLAPQLGLRLGSVVEWVLEAHFAGYLGEADGWMLGVLPVGARFELPRTHLRPYLAVQAGFGWTNLDILELDRRFNFILSGGLGVRWPKAKHGEGLLELRFLHYSNANTAPPNLGLNSVCLVGGWRFR